MQEKKCASPSQLRALFLVGVMAPGVRLIPAAMLPAAGAGVWLCPIAALPVCYAVGRLTARLWNSARDGQTAPEWLREKLGKTGAVLALLPAGLWLSLYAGFLMRSAAERLISTIYNNGEALFFVGVTLAVTVWAALGSVRTLGRMGRLVLPALAALLTLSCVLGAGDVKPENLIPEVSRLSGIPAGALSVIDVCTLMLYSPLLMGECCRNGKPTRKTGTMALWIVAGSTLMCAAVVGTLSAAVAETVQYPFFIMVRNLAVFGEKERIEAVVIALWLVSDLVFLSTLLRSAGWALGGLREKQATTPGVWCAGLLAAASAAGWGITALDMETVSNVLVPGINLFFTLIYIPFLLLVGNRREKRRARREEKTKCSGL